MSEQQPGEPGHEIDPVILEYVTTVANRFGVAGLEDMIREADAQRATAQAALDELGTVEEPPGTGGGGDPEGTPPQG